MIKDKHLFVYDVQSSSFQKEVLSLEKDFETYINTTLPKYEYTGNDPRIAAIYDYLEKEYEKVSPSSESVFIPIPKIYKFSKTSDGFKVYGSFWTEEYNIYGTMLLSDSGGDNPGVMYLTKQGDSYKVTKTEYADSGSEFAPSIKKICKGYPGISQKMSSEQYPSEICRQNISTYVKNNHLKISYYKDFGWDKIPIE